MQRLEGQIPGSVKLETADENRLPRNPSEQIVKIMRESRKGGLIDVSLLRAGLKAADKHVQQTWNRDGWYFRNVIQEIDIYGDRSLAHLCLPRTIRAPLSRSEVHTTSQLRQKLEEPEGLNTLVYGVGLKRIEDIREHLKEFDRLRQSP